MSIPKFLAFVGLKFRSNMVSYCQIWKSSIYRRFNMIKLYLFGWYFLPALSEDIIYSNYFYLNLFLIELPSELSQSINAIDILKNNLDKIDWINSPSNNKHAINILKHLRNDNSYYSPSIYSSPSYDDYEEYDDNETEWIEFQVSCYAMKNELYGLRVPLKRTKDKVNRMFKLDSIDNSFLKSKMDIIREELMMKVCHPLRFERYLNMGYDIAADEYLN